MFTLCPAFPPVLLQENQALQAKQRELQAALAAAQRDVTLAAGQQERITALEAEVAQAQAAAAEAQQQLELVASRSGVLEKAYAAAQQVGPGLKETWWCYRGASAVHVPLVKCLTRREPPQPCPFIPPPTTLQESSALQTKQRELQSALAAAHKDVRAAAGQQERISALEAEVAQALASAAAAHEQLALDRKSLG